MEVGGQLSSVATLPPWETAPCTQWISGWVDPNGVLDTAVKRKYSLPPPTRIINNAQLRMEGRNMIGNMVSEMLQRAVCLQNNRKHFIISDMTNAVAMRCW